MGMHMHTDILNILNRVNDAIVAFDKEGNISYVNKAFADTLGLSASQMIGKNIWKLRPRLVDSVIYKTVTEAIERKEYRIVEWKSSYTDSFWESKIFPSVEGVITIGRDITERKKAQECLTDSNEKLQGILNAIEEGISLVGLDGRVLDCNEASSKLIGLAKDEFIGMNVYDIIVPEDRQRAIDGAAKVLETGRIVNEVGVLRKNGEPFCGEISVAMLRDKNGNPAGFVGITRDITERKKIETEMKESEQLYRTLFENTDDGFMLVEPIYNENGNAYDIRFLKFNAAYERQTGAKADDALGRKASEVVPELEPEIISLSGKVAKTGKSAYSETFDKYSNKWYDSHYIPFAKGQVGILFRDITIGKKAEEALKESEERLKIYLEGSPAGVFVANTDGRFLYANEAASKLLGYSKEEFLNMGVFDVTFEDERNINLERFNELRKTGKAWGESRFKRKDGSPVFVILNATKLPNGNIIANCENITERKKAEEALKESEKRFQSLFEQSPTAFEIYDKNGLQIQTNHAWEKMWNVPREYTNGKFNIFESKQIVEMGLLPYVKKAYAGETVIVPETPFDASLEPQTLGEGRKRWLRSIYYPIMNVHGEVINVVVMHEDVTEKKNLEKQLQDNERMAAIGQTAGMVGHDIRNPLQAIISELYIAKGVIAQAPESKDKQEALDSVNFVEEQVNYINKIVSDLQDYARPLKPEYAIVDLPDLIVSVFDTIVLPDKIKLNVDVKDNLKVKTDPTFVKRSITNLVNNAVQAMPDGGELGLSAQKKEECIVICVSDTGQGIPEHVKANLFTPLTTTKAKGQGLGLAVVKRLIEALNGKVSFESEEGKGTKFILELPLNK